MWHVAILDFLKMVLASPVPGHEMEIWRLRLEHRQSSETSPLPVHTLPVPGEPFPCRFLLPPKILSGLRLRHEQNLKRKICVGESNAQL